jgi:hypothetical protein
VPHSDDAPEPDIELPPRQDIEREVRRDFRNVPYRFSREGWFWTIIEDIRWLAAHRYPGGIVPEGWRDTFAFLIAHALVRIFPPSIVYPEMRHRDAEGPRGIYRPRLGLCVSFPQADDDRPSRSHERKCVTWAR